MKVYLLSSLSEPLPKEDFLWIALDVIRATSTIVTFFAYGGDSLFITSSIREAKSLKRENPDILLMGERGGAKIPGFDFDNSPTDVMENAHMIKGKRAVLTTTNGTRLIKKLSDAGRRILIGSMLNLSAVLRRALEEVKVSGFDGVAIACAGKEGRVASDDLYCAGRMVLRLEKLLPQGFELNDSALIAKVWASQEKDALSVFLNSSSGKNALSNGRYRDVEFCSKEDLFEVVPLLSGEREIKKEV